MEQNPQLSTLIARKMEATESMLQARDGMEQARQAYEFYLNRVDNLNAEIARLAITVTQSEVQHVEM